VDIKKKADKGNQNHISDPAPFVQDIFQLNPRQSKVDQGDRIKEENIIKERIVGDPAYEERQAGAEPKRQEDGRPDEKKEKRGQSGPVAQETDCPQDPEVTGQVFDSFLYDDRHGKAF